jgi:hypothetical protein
VTETLVDLLEKSFSETKSYEKLVMDGAAMERLMKNDDFKIWHRLLAEAYLMLVKRNSRAEVAQLATMQGALIQHEIIMSLPEKVSRVAEEQVLKRRGDQ